MGTTLNPNQIQMRKSRESTDDKQETTHNYDTHTHTHPYRSVPVMFGGQHPILSLLRDTGTPSHQLAVVEQPNRFTGPKSNGNRFKYRSV